MVVSSLFSADFPPDITAKLGAIAQRLQGAPTQIRFAMAGTEAKGVSPSDKLDQLKQFGEIVKFR